MGFWNKIFGKSDQQKVGGMEDFMTLIRVYFQAAMASDLGITNLAALPDLRVFKATLKVPTVNNKLGVGERSRCKKMLKEMYGMEDDFFKEIDQSLRKRCKKIQDAQTYLLQFQGFTQDIMMLTGNLMKFKLRLPGFMKKALYTMTEKTVNDIFNKNLKRWVDEPKTGRHVNIVGCNQELDYLKHLLKSEEMRNHAKVILGAKAGDVVQTF